MSTQDISTDDTRHIHDALGGSKEFIRGFTLKDIALLFGPFFLVLFPLGLPFTPSTLTVPIVGLAVATIPTMALLFKTKASHLTFSESLSSKIEWTMKRKSYELGDADHSDALYVTRIEQVHENSIERLDGAYVGAVRIDPANMALETEESWMQAVHSFANYANTTFEFKTQIYITGREVNPKDHIDHLEDRLNDADVRQRPVLGQLIERFISWYSGRLKNQGVHTREYYIIVPVTDDDVESPDKAQDTIIDYLADIPVLGAVFSRIQTRQEGLTDEQRSRLKQQKLESRLKQVRTGANGLYGCRGEVVESYEFARVLKEYWSGTEENYQNIERALGSLPLVTTDTDTGERTYDGLQLDEETQSDIETEVSAELSDFMDAETDDDALEAKKDVVRSYEAQKVLQDIGTTHKSFFAPTTIDWEKQHGVIDGDTYVRTYWIESFPEYPSDGFLERVLLESNLETDISIHLNPFDTQEALDALDSWISSLQVTFQELSEAGEIRAEDIEKDIERAKSIRSTVRSNETSLFRGGVYLRVTADDLDTLRQRSQELESMLKDVPANATPKPATRWQEKGLRTVSPLGMNDLGNNRMSTMTGSAVGTMFPFSSNYYMNNDGIEYGIHGHNGTPVLIDPFDLDTGHNELVVGDIGAGKTFDIKKNLIRTLQGRNDVKVVMLDPVQEFRGLVDAFGGSSVVVGGQTKLNPMHIEKTPTHVLENADGDLDPLAAKKDEVMSFLDNFFGMEDIRLGDRRGVLRYAISKVYDDAGITSQVQTHSRPSPTLTDLIEKVTDIAENPSAHDIVSSESGYSTVSEYANALEMALQPFKDGGTYENLADENAVDILSSRNSDDMVYIDLQQEDGRGDSNKGFMMQLLLSTVYQQAKNTDKKVVFAIDEAHYLLRNKQNLDYIQQIVRHSRHVDMRLVLASQTLEEFYTNEDTRTIANQCSVKVFHKLTGLDAELAEEIGLSPDQRDFVRGAAAGDEELGYSEALVQVKEEGSYPVQVQVSDLEQELIDHGMDGEDLLGALAKNDEEREAFRSFLRGDGAIRTLFEYYDMSQEQAEELVENGIEYGDLVDALINTMEELPGEQSGLEDWVGDRDTTPNATEHTDSDSQEANDDDSDSSDAAGEQEHWSESEYWAGREDE